MPDELEFGGYKYIKVRLPEIERLNRAFKKLYSLFHESSMHIDFDRYKEISYDIYLSYLDHAYGIITNAFGVSEDDICDLLDVADNESSARYCYVLVREDRKAWFYASYEDVYGFDPEVYVREDVKG